MYTNCALRSKLSLLVGGGGLLIGEKEESLERKSCVKYSGGASVPAANTPGSVRGVP